MLSCQVHSTGVLLQLSTVKSDRADHLFKTPMGEQEGCWMLTCYVYRSLVY